MSDNTNGDNTREIKLTHNYMPIIEEAIKNKEVPNILYEIEDNTIYGDTDIGTILEVCGKFNLPVQDVLSGNYPDSILALAMVKHFIDEDIERSMFEQEFGYDEYCPDCQAEIEKEKRKKIDKTGNKIVKFRKKDQDEEE